MSEPRTRPPREPLPTESAEGRRGPIQRLVEASLDQRLLVALLAVAIIGVGIFSLYRLPVDAYPDVSPTGVELTAQWPGHAAEEVERLITVPLETELNGLPNIEVTRSVSLYGLSNVRVTFTDGTDLYFARQQVFERLSGVELPDGVAPEIEAPFSPSGLVYRYVLRSPDRSARELHVLQDWVLDKAYRAVPGVADVSSLGGETMQYQVQIDPTRLAGAGLAVGDVVDALNANNGNAGGGFYSQGGQFFYVRGLGRVATLEDIGNIVLTVRNGTPVLVKDVGTVQIGAAPRLGQFGFDAQDDAVEGVILMRTGEQAQVVLKRVEEKTRELNEHVLPKDVKVVPYYDRGDLVSLTTRTVADNLLRGILLVVVVLIFFLYDVRSGLIVAATIPLSLLVAFVCLDLRHIPANLLSIGAIDFGILVDGAVVMVENIYRQLARRHGTEYSIRDVILSAASEVNRPIVYAIAVIVAAFLPIYALSGASGKLFRPMADTTIFALLGALVLTLTVVPVLCAWGLKGGVVERRNRPFEWLRGHYTRALDWCLAHVRATVATSIALFVASLALAALLGGEFMPKLDEGALWVRATMPYTISFEESSGIVPQVRKILRSFPEVTVVTSEHGRDDAGTDPTGFFNAEFYVGLKPYREWHGLYRTKDELILAIQKKLAVYPGITFNYTQPAEDAVDEALTGLKASLDVKVFGTDLTLLEQKGREIKGVIERVRGINHVTLVQELGQPSLTVTANREKLSRYGLNVAAVNGLIEAAVGGVSATEVVQGERTFDLVVRLQPQFRETPEQIGNILIATPDGQQIPLREVADISLANGASFIYRQDNSRYIGVQYSVEGRDLASAVAEARRAVERQVKLPTGYATRWGGEFEEYTASRAEMNVVLPITVVLIFAILFVLYHNFKFPLITVGGVILSAPLGGLLALALTGTPLSVSAMIGFLALFGVSVQTAVVYISYANELRLGGFGIADATRAAALLRLRPIMMTALVAALGLLPAALSHGVGSDTQRPFAMVIVGGLFSRLLISVFLMPVLYLVTAREGDHLEV
ncbi:heavy metal efflux pump, CzcA family [Gemmatirosa kalamazoonensis]|uniref:Heavy metal efflux pump, CzcA family n=1 Tax=Gemmatirosa kalamazoonensis TaxID=861299 RepID=W0RPA7_9BACT|nr:CusA/CzcA family heavy metal efflux RND transporter [Gemmatirosa kalamazoonensis]AHG91303.1 heavy metal efflux pump, CzcA family [Gemmatirosa kalamazoonensis]